MNNFYRQQNTEFVQATILFSLLFLLLKVDNSSTNNEENEKPQSLCHLQLLTLPAIGCFLSTWNFLLRVFQQPARLKQTGFNFRKLTKELSITFIQLEILQLLECQVRLPLQDHITASCLTACPVKGKDN